MISGMKCVPCLQMQRVSTMAVPMKHCQASPIEGIPPHAVRLFGPIIVMPLTLQRSGMSALTTAVLTDLVNIHVHQHADGACINFQKDSIPEYWCLLLLCRCFSCAGHTVVMLKCKRQLLLLYRKGSVPGVLLIHERLSCRGMGSDANRRFLLSGCACFLSARMLTDAATLAPSRFAQC